MRKYWSTFVFGDITLLYQKLCVAQHGEVCCGSEKFKSSYNIIERFRNKRFNAIKGKEKTNQTKSVAFVCITDSSDQIQDASWKMTRTGCHNEFTD